MSALQVIEQIPNGVLVAIGAIFLVFSVLVTARAIRWAEWSAASHDDWYDEVLDDYDLAYLAGGVDRVFETATASLFMRGVVCLRPGTGLFIVQGELPEDAHAAERAVYYYFAIPSAVGNWATCQAYRTLRRTIVTLFDRLKAEGYHVAEWRVLAVGSFIAIELVVAACLSWLLHRASSGIHNIGPWSIGPWSIDVWSTSQTEKFLIWMWMLFFLIVCQQASRFYLTQKGPRTVAVARARYAALRPPYTGPQTLFDGQDLVLSVGLFGLDKWRQGPLAEIHFALHPPGVPG